MIPEFMRKSAIAWGIDRYFKGDRARAKNALIAALDKLSGTPGFVEIRSMIMDLLEYLE